MRRSSTLQLSADVAASHEYSLSLTSSNALSNARTAVDMVARSRTRIDSLVAAAADDGRAIAADGAHLPRSDSI